MSLSTTDRSLLHYQLLTPAYAAADAARAFPRRPSSASFPILEDLRYLRDPIFSFLLLLNKNNNLLKQQDASRHATKHLILQGFCNTEFPQSTRNYPSNHEWISLSPRVISLKPRALFPQTTSGFPSTHKSISLKPRIGSKNRLESG